jgi:hypothetical protein
MPIERDTRFHAKALDDPHSAITQDEARSTKRRAAALRRADQPKKLSKFFADSPFVGSGIDLERKPQSN